MGSQYSDGTNCMLTKWVKFLSFTQAPEFEPTLSLNQYTVPLKGPPAEQADLGKPISMYCPFDQRPSCLCFLSTGLEAPPAVMLVLMPKIPPQVTFGD